MSNSSPIWLTRNPEDSGRNEWLFWLFEPTQKDKVVFDSQEQSFIPAQGDCGLWDDLNSFPVDRLVAELLIKKAGATLPVVGDKIRLFMTVE